MSKRVIILILILVVVPLGFATKFYRGWGDNWVSNSLGGLLYVIFWCLVVFFLKPETTTMLWWGVAKADLNQRMSDEKKKTRVRKAVLKLLDKYPPTQ